MGRVGFLLLLVLVLSGCAGGIQLARQDLQGPDLPLYVKGTTYLYSDGGWERVRDVRGEEVSWLNHRGKVYKGSMDFILPATYWKTKKREGRRSFYPITGIFDRDGSDSLWPLYPGKSFRFLEKGRWRDLDGPERPYYRYWFCKVIGKERVSVLIGDFDGWRIECKRFNRRHRLREIRTWHYVPEVGHYVLYVRKVKRRPEKRVELLAILPPRDSLPQQTARLMDDSFQKALEFNRSGVPVRWTDPGSGVSGEVVPLGTFRTGDGLYCRRYRQTILSRGMERRYYGLACRIDGKWRVPYIE